MTSTDRAEFLAALAGLDNCIGEITKIAQAEDREAIKATSDDGPLPSTSAPLIAQIGNVAKSIGLLTNFLIESQPALLAALASAGAPAAKWQRLLPEQCSFCPRPAADLPTADWPMCRRCFNQMGAFDPVLDAAALEIAEALR